MTLVSHEHVVAPTQNVRPRFNGPTIPAAGLEPQNHVPTNAFHPDRACRHPRSTITMYVHARGGGKGSSTTVPRRMQQRVVQKKHVGSSACGFRGEGGRGSREKLGSCIGQVTLRVCVLLKGELLTGIGEVQIRRVGSRILRTTM